MAPTLSDPPAHRVPSESHGGEPDTTPSGRCDGTLKCDRNSSTNMPSKSGGSFTAVSSDVTDILMTVAMESVAGRIARQADRATRRSDGIPVFGFAQATSKKRAATVA